MTRTEFMRALTRALYALPLAGGKYLPEAECASALRYYEEYLDDAGIAPEDPVPAELNDPEALAREIIAEAGEDAPKASAAAAAPADSSAWPEFRSVQIDVVNAAVTFLAGSSYHVQIEYPEDAPVPNVEMRGQTLCIEDQKRPQRFRLFSFRSWKGGQIRITVPAEKAVSFESFHIETVNGAITLPALAVEDVHCETVNGGITLTGLTADRLHCETVNGGISLASCYAHQRMHCESVNGGVAFDGELRGKTHAETVNGSIRIATALPITAYDLDLRTVSGGVYLDGEKHRKEVHISNSAGNSVRAETVNGAIKLEFCK